MLWMTMACVAAAGSFKTDQLALILLGGFNVGTALSEFARLLRP